MRLGAGVPIGKSTVSVSDRFRVLLGPLNEEDYSRFLPGETARKRLEEWIRYYIGTGMDWDLQLVMESPSARKFQLGKHGRLRRDAWMGSKRPSYSMEGYHRQFESMSWVQRGDET